MFPEPLQLSPQLRKVAALVAEGMNKASIAKELNLSVGSIRMYLHRIYITIGVRNRVELAIWVMNKQKKESGN